MRDLGENLAVLDAIRPADMGVAEYNVRANGAHATGGEIDLEDYGYPRKILVCVGVGEVAAGGTLNIDIESGDATGVLTNTDVALNEMIAVGDQIYEYTPTRRFINIEAIVAVDNITFCVGLVMEHARFAKQGTA